METGLRSATVVDMHTVSTVEQLLKRLHILSVATTFSRIRLGSKDGDEVSLMLSHLPVL